MRKSINTTTRERQIEFMWHLYKQGFTQQEIANVYNVKKHRIETALTKRVKIVDFKGRKS